MLSYYATGAHDQLTAPDIIHYKGLKFYLTASENPFGYHYQTLKENGKEYGRLDFYTHPDKDYYYMVFQELRDCGPFCGIDHHRFQLFLK